MNEISHTQRKPTLSSSTKVNAPPKQADVDDFDRSLRRLEKEPQDNTNVNQNQLNQNQLNQFMQKQPVSENVNLRVNETVEENGKTDPAAGKDTPRQLSLSNDERNTSQESHRLDAGDAIDAILDTSIPHWLPPPGVETTELMLNSSTMMTLHDFTSLLEQGWHPRSSNGEQVWRFTLQDTGLSLARIVLKGDGVANGYWSVALTAHGEDKLALSQHLQQLRTRLEKLGNNITRVAFAEEHPQ